MARKRLRELGITIGNLPTGPNNCITDIDGILVGHLTIQKENVCSGLSIILPNNGILENNHFPAGIFSFNGTGEFTGSHWIEETGTLLSPIIFTGSHLLGKAHRYLSEATRKFDSLEPFSLVSIGETWDGWLSHLESTDIDYNDMEKLIKSAKTGVIEEGAVGGGTGMIAFEFKGGIGSSSREVSTDFSKFTVGTMVQANMGRRHDLVINGVEVGKQLDESTTTLPWNTPDNDGSLLVTVATDAPLLPYQCKRISRRASLAMAKLGVIGEEGSGDFFITFSTGNKFNYNQSTPSPMKSYPNEELDSIFEATIECVQEAILNSITTAKTTKGQLGRTVHEIPLEELKKLF